MPHAFLAVRVDTPLWALLIALLQDVWQVPILMGRLRAPHARPAPTRQLLELQASPPVLPVLQAPSLRPCGLLPLVSDVLRVHTALLQDLPLAQLAQRAATLLQQDLLHVLCVQVVGLT